MANLADEFGEAMASGGTDHLWNCPKCKTDNVTDYGADDEAECQSCGAVFRWDEITTPEQREFLDAQSLYPTTGGVQ